MWGDMASCAVPTLGPRGRNVYPLLRLSVAARRITILCTASPCPVSHLPPSANPRPSRNIPPLLPLSLPPRHSRSTCCALRILPTLPPLIGYHACRLTRGVSAASRSRTTAMACGRSKVMSHLGTISFHAYRRHTLRHPWIQPPHLPPWPQPHPLPLPLSSIRPQTRRPRPRRARPSRAINRGHRAPRWPIRPTNSLHTLPAKMCHPILHYSAHPAGGSHAPAVPIVCNRTSCM